jgi:hypothetical protein
MLVGHTAGNTMGVRACTEEQIMFAYIFQVYFDGFWAMVGVVDLNAIQGDLGSYLVK